MRASIVIAACNEGDALVRTLESCIEAAPPDCELVVVDDASSDGSAAMAAECFPIVRLVRQDRRTGASPSKALGARQARGERLVFMDAHCKPEPGAIMRLLEAAERHEDAIITPAIAPLDVAQWRTDLSQLGHGYAFDLQRFECGWLPLDELRSVDGGSLYESPALIGCACAVSRDLYQRLWGFDPHMRSWGVEDLDFGLKAWLLGARILHEPRAVVGHRFRSSFDNYEVPIEDLLMNQLRMARKQFTPAVWESWLDSTRARVERQVDGHPEGVWARTWNLFEANRRSVERERSYLQSHRLHDEFWYARRFGLDWPRLAAVPDGNAGPAGSFAEAPPVGAAAGVTAPRAGAVALAASPSPPPRAGIALVSPTPQQTLALTAAPAMPQLIAEARITGVTPDPTASTDFTWTFTITFNASTCRHGPHRQINPPPFQQTSHGGRLTVAFPLVRGGNLQVAVRAVVGGRTLSAQSQGVRIPGTNPPTAEIDAALPHDALRRMAHVESTCRQFDAPANAGTSACPLWSGDNLGGVGIMQITNPSPTDDEVWNWRANVQRGVSIFNTKLGQAHGYPARVRQRPGFQQLVQQFNANRAAQGLPAITVTLPDFTSSGFNVAPGQLGQLELDAIRGYNGFGGHDAFGLELHEFRVQVDAQGHLVVDIAPGATGGTARWERVPVASRPQGFGDPDYVNHVIASPPC